MITLEGKTWNAECDRCGEAIDTGQKSFQQAVNYLSRAEGWESRKIRGTWKNYCPRCGEEGDPDMDLAGIGFTRRPAIDD